jgi:lysozyme
MGAGEVVAALDAIDWLKRHLREEEGCRASAYRDSEGWWTIGIGHRLPVDTTSADAAAMRWTDADIEAAFEADVREAIHNASSFGWWHVLSPIRQAVIAAMCFQLGRDGVAGFTRMAEEIKAGRTHGVAREMLDSKWHRQTPQRCNRLAKAYRDGV